MKEIKIFKTREVKTPHRGSPLSAGIDFFVPEQFTSVTLEPHDDVLIPSGIKVKLPDGYALVGNNKSGVATKKRLIYGACVIDEDYQGEIHLHLINVGKNPVTINPGDKILQFLLEKQEYAGVIEVTSEEELFGGELTERGEGGFGSTGSK
jgi:dUTP pyrophosphatase